MPKKIELSREQINRIIELYQSGMTQKRIGREMGIDENKIRRTLQAEKVKAREPKEYLIMFNKEESKEIIELYKGGLNQNELAEKYGCSKKAIANVLKRNNIVKRTPSEAYRTYSINDYYFDEIDNQDKAYILGFLYADGCNASYYDKNHYNIGMTLQICDKYILDEMCHKMGMNRDASVIINSTNKKLYARIDIMNKHMVFQLDKLGVVPNKTRKTRFPYWMKKELYPHFIRGLLDGDGSIPKRLDRVHFCGSNGLMNDLADVINDKFGYRPTVGNYKTCEGISYVQLCGTKKRLEFLDWIYCDAEMKLTRKYDLYLKMKELYSCKLAG